MILKEYNQKRNFDNTPEPQGKVRKNKNRFVIQHHFARKEHYDFRLEYNGVLLSFAVPKNLSENPNDKRLAVHVEDHPVDYINFEGVIPKGNYGAGSVRIFDKGDFVEIENFEKGLKKGHLKFQLFGKKFKGVWSLVRTKEPNWLIIKSSEDVLDREQSFKNLKNPFKQVDVKLATLTNMIPSKDYIFEIKYDGYRILAFREKETKLVSRNNNDYTQKFQNIAKSLNVFEHSFVLDGEVVVFDKNGVSNFGLLTDHIKNSIHDYVYVVFDILALDGKDLRDENLLKRKEILKDIFKTKPHNIILSSYVKNGEKSFEVAKKLGLEGIVAKKENSKYNSKRDEDWLKIKCYKRQEFVIGGYSTTDKNNVLSAIYVGYYKNKELVFVGKVGTGFNRDKKDELSRKFEKILRKTSPFNFFEDKKVKFVKPKYVAEIQFAEITSNGLLRQPSFVGLRSDKKPSDVVLEEEND